MLLQITISLLLLVLYVEFNKILFFVIIIVIFFADNNNIITIKYLFVSYEYTVYSNLYLSVKNDGEHCAPQATLQAAAVSNGI